MTSHDVQSVSSSQSAMEMNDPRNLVKKMGNTIGKSNRLRTTYVPGQVAIVRSVDKARGKGRKVLSEQNPIKSPKGGPK